jgi:DNA-binding NarL/FixJ family response regulator
MTDATPIATIRVMCVDDHPVVRQGLAAMLASDPAMELIAEATSGEHAIASYREHRPDVTLMDLRLPGIAGVEAIIAIRSEFPQARIAVLTTEGGDVLVQRALAAGARGYILKGTPMVEVLDAIRAIHAGRMRIPQTLAMQLAEHITHKSLSAREVQVLQLVAGGYRNKSIAAQLDISEETVKMHVKNAMAKLDANDRTHAVTIALQRGILIL